MSENPKAILAAMYFARGEDHKIKLVDSREKRKEETKDEDKNE